MDGVVVVVLEERNGGQSEQLGGGIASDAAPEALLPWISDIEQQEWIRQMGVGHRMAGCAPFAEQDQALMLRFLQEGLQIGTMQVEPGCQT